MSRISFMGSFSGIDGSQIDALMEAERMPIVQMSNKKVDIQEKQNAWKDINTRLNSLYDKIKVLQDPKTFASKTVTSGESKYASFSVNERAIDGDYRINVKQLATNSKIIGSKIEEELSPGQFTIENGDGHKFNIEIEEGDKLKDLVAKINEASVEVEEDGKTTSKKIGIKATIVDNRLVLEDTKSGEREIKLGGEALGSLGLKDAELQKGQQAIFSINGVEDIRRDSNTISDAIEGVTITLKDAHGINSSASETISVGTDFAKAEKAIDDFVKQYNSTMNFIKDQSKAGDPEVPGSAGALSGDSSLVRLEANLRRMVGSTIDKDGPIKDAGQLGISTFDRYGDLKFDSSKFRAAMKEDPKAVQDFFGKKETGFVSKVNAEIDRYISKTDGVAKIKNESFDKALKRINEDIDRFNERMDRKEEHYVRMFSRLDVAMMQAESQMDWLMGQVSAMNAQAKK